MQGKRVTIFGGSGFLGRDLVKHLLAAGARVRIASRNPDAALSLEAFHGDERLLTTIFDAILE